MYAWNGDGRRVSHIVIDTDEQKARFYDEAEEIGWATVATGVSRHPTPTGRFAVMEKVENKRSNLYGRYFGAGGKLIQSNVKVGRDPAPDGARFVGAKMPYFMRLTYDGIGLHAGPIPRPGRPASHGCIRVPAEVAPLLFAKVGRGTPVIIIGSGPDYGDYAKRQQRLAAERTARAQRTPAPAQTVPEPPPPAATVQPRRQPQSAPSSAAPQGDAATAAQTTTITEPAPTEDVPRPPEQTTPRLTPNSGMAQHPSPGAANTAEANEG
ncbi:L,D-transpeptidase [Marichromatium bheemlicum]|uniref:L,D-transpeptidase n=1 Tax=Marichromatium bheemlicum TaxID=365339 RepID=UPI001B2FE5B8|nr:L,D-transpeptidase [Marichromatium bheemlicum]